MTTRREKREAAKLVRLAAEVKTLEEKLRDAKARRAQTLNMVRAGADKMFVAAFMGLAKEGVREARVALRYLIETQSDSARAAVEHCCARHGIDPQVQPDDETLPKGAVEIRRTQGEKQRTARRGRTEQAPARAAGETAVDDAPKPTERANATARSAEKKGRAANTTRPRRARTGKTVDGPNDGATAKPTPRKRAGRGTR